MSTLINININIDDDEWYPEQHVLQEWVDLSLSDKYQNSEISISLVSRSRIQDLNSQYRGKNNPTNVLSFPVNNNFIIENVKFIGDLVICPVIIKEESIKYNKDLNSRWAHIVIHGCLHLLGYDHIYEEDAVAMEKLETELLFKLGFDDPYISC